MIMMASMWSISSRSTFLAIRQSADHPFVHVPIRQCASLMKRPRFLPAVETGSARAARILRPDPSTMATGFL